MEPIYSNFDGLDVSFQCALPQAVLDILDDAKKKAQETKSDAVARLGKNETVVLVAETGCTGGFAYRFDTGFHGETWMVSKSLKKDGWNVMVSVKSLTMALYGYDKVKDKILGFLVNDLEASGVSRLDRTTGKVTNAPLEAISRFDFCIDFKTDVFWPDIRAFVAKGRFKRRLLNTNDGKSPTSEAVFSGRKAKYFRVGSMPNREVVMYDKISEITDKKKPFWWGIWGIEKSEFKGEIWRIEARAGKKELKKWNLRRFSDFEKMAGDIISSLLKDIKYTVPSSTDTNISRWPMAQFWLDAIRVAEQKLQSHMSDATRTMVIEGYRLQMSDQFEKSILGQMVSYAALHGRDVSEIPDVLDVLGEAMMKRLSQNPKKFQEKHQKAIDRYSQLD